MANKYSRDISHLHKLDIYRILSLYAVSDPCLQHAAKKVLCAGQRGAKDQLQDVHEAIASLERFVDMRCEDVGVCAEDTDARLVYRTAAHAVVNAVEGHTKANVVNLIAELLELVHRSPQQSLEKDSRVNALLQRYAQKPGNGARAEFSPVNLGKM
jgi:hypothetical protein